MKLIQTTCFNKMINNWIANKDYPGWMTEESLKTLQRQHLGDNESPFLMYSRIINTLGERYKKMIADKTGEGLYDVDFVTQKWFEYIWKGWLCPSTPILSNVGTEKGLPISCFINRPHDSINGIYSSLHEMAMLSKYGGGIGITFDKIRGRGTAISTGGFTEGVIPFIKVYDSGIIAANQGAIRRGAASINLPIRHKDIKEFIKIRLPEGDMNRKSLNINHCVTIDDFFMESLINRDPHSLEIWSDVLGTRMRTGQPYIMYYHNANKNKPEDFKKRNLKIDGTNICTEIMLPHDDKHTVVCDLASLNFSKYDEWKNEELFIELCLLFLDVNLEEFIFKATNIPMFEKAVNFAQKSRAIGLGILGFATYLQNKNIPFISLSSRAIIKKYGEKIKLDGDTYNKKWGKLLGSPEWCDENRNSTLFAIAPTTTNSLVSGGVSQGMEPLISNSYVQKTAKGTFIRKNPTFEKLITKKYPDKNTESLWLTIDVDYKGSVQHLDFLTEEEKEVFLTAYEINQLELVKQAAIMQKYIDQGISLNLFFPADVSPKWLNKVHITAWEEGLKSLYYVRTTSIASSNINSNAFVDCTYCEA